MLEGVSFVNELSPVSWQWCVVEKTPRRRYRRFGCVLDEDDEMLV